MPLHASPAPTASSANNRVREWLRAGPAHPPPPVEAFEDQDDLDGSVVAHDEYGRPASPDVLSLDSVDAVDDGPYPDTMKTARPPYPDIPFERVVSFVDDVRTPILCLVLPS